MKSWAPIFAPSPRAASKPENSERDRHFPSVVIPSVARDLKLTVPHTVRVEQRGDYLDFQLNDEQLHLKKTVREFAEREIAPNVMKWDEAGEFPLTTIKELGKL